VIPGAAVTEVLIMMTPDEYAELIRRTLRTHVAVRVSFDVVDTTTLGGSPQLIGGAANFRLNETVRTILPSDAFWEMVAEIKTS
jgi:acid phosphatase class B